MWPFGKEARLDRVLDMELKVSSLERQCASTQAELDRCRVSAWKWQERANMAVLETDRIRNRFDCQARLLESLRGLAELCFELTQKNGQDSPNTYERYELSGVAAEYESIAVARASVRTMRVQLAVECARSKEAISTMREMKKNCSSRCESACTEQKDG